jgi:beta-lactamase class A
MAKRSYDSGLSTETVFAMGGFVVGAFVAGVAAFFIVGSQSTPATHALRESDITGAQQYQFIDPLIGVSSTQTNAPQYATLQQTISSYIAKAQQNGLTSASVRFGDIHAAEGFTVNPQTLYSPASLYKVPMMLAYYKLAEIDPSILTQRIIYSGGQNLDASENIPSPVQLTVGASYTVEELIEHMIEYSDNNALTLLTNYLTSSGHMSALSDTLTDLGVPYGTSNDFLSVNTYIIFFRALYNATYLSDEYSEKALALLSKTDFTEGIETGIPNNVEVAHKFGDSNELTNAGAADGFELHDCGIVYYPDHPYMLCIMTKGSTVAQLESVISGVSQLVYKDLEQRYPAAAAN